MTIAFVVGSNAPYAHRLYDAYATRHGADITVFQCATSEPSRRWQMPDAGTYKLVTLPGYRYHKSDISHVYVNPGIVSALARLKPLTVVMASFSPTMIMAGLHAVSAGASLGLLIEGERSIDPGETSTPHRLARRYFARRAAFGHCTSELAREMMESWGLPRGAGVLIPHFGSWDAPARIPSFDERPFDLLFCGTMNERKNPLFFAEVVERMVARGMRPRVRVVGDGPMRETFTSRLAGCGIEIRLDGYLQAADIIDAYSSAKLLLFPTHADTWGLVNNEAMLCGTPVLASPHAVSSKELVAKYATGLVRDLDADAWTGAALDMLSSAERWSGFMARRREAMAYHSLDTAVAGLARAIDLGRTTPRRSRPAPGEAGRSGQIGLK